MDKNTKLMIVGGSALALAFGYWLYTQKKKPVLKVQTGTVPPTGRLPSGNPAGSDQAARDAAARDQAAKDAADAKLEAQQAAQRASIAQRTMAYRPVYMQTRQAMLQPPPPPPPPPPPIASTKQTLDLGPLGQIEFDASLVWNAAKMMLSTAGGGELDAFGLTFALPANASIRFNPVNQRLYFSGTISVTFPDDQGNPKTQTVNESDAFDIPSGTFVSSSS